MKHTFNNELVSKEALEHIIGKKYAYILDAVEHTLDFGDTNEVSTSVDVWIGDTGITYIDVFYRRMLGEPLYNRLAVAHFVIKKSGTSLETAVTITTDETDDRYTTYKDIEIPSPKKLEKVLSCCM